MLSMNYHYFLHRDHPVSDSGWSCGWSRIDHTTAASASAGSCLPKKEQPWQKNQ